MTDRKAMGHLWISGRRMLAASLLLAFALAGAPDRAEARSCPAMQRELVSLRSGGGGSGAMTGRQAAATLAALKVQARQAGCMGGGFLMFRRTPQAICSSLMPRIRRLEAQAGRGGGKATSGRRIAALQARISAECVRPRVVEARADPKPPRPERTERRRTAPEPADRAADTPHTIVVGGGEGGGTFRTMCVRTCDGYYFPISFSTTRDRFQADQAACEAACPGTAVALFYHPDPTSEAEGMVSLSDEPYTSLPNAFRYRAGLDKACTCGRPSRRLFSVASRGRKGHRGFSVIATGDAPPTTEPAPSLLPRPRVATGADPETLANREEGLSLDAVAALKGTLADAPVGRGIRQVGPVPPGAQEQAVLLQVPGPRRDP